MTATVERTILTNLITNEEYTRRVIPFLREEYFRSLPEKAVFRVADDYINKYNRLPAVEALAIEVDALTGFNDVDIKEAKKILSSANQAPADLQWMIDTTEKFCKQRAVYNAVAESFKIIDDPKYKGKHNKEGIPKLLEEALAVSFDTNIGIDLLEDVDMQWEFMHSTVERIPFDLSFLNKITRGGLPKKTLTVFMAGIGVGKSLTMCHMASNNLAQGKNVLYITLELQDFEVTRRINANLLNTKLEDFVLMSREEFVSRVQDVKKKTTGKLIVKEYPTGSVGSNHFRHLLNELRIKKNFTPDVIYVDYINLCMSSRLRRGGVNSYEYIKSIAEEIRGLAMEFNLPIVTATQVNRSGYKDMDFDLENTSESFGLPATADIMLALIASDEFRELNQYMVKQLKNRFYPVGKNTRFMIGVDGDRMRLYDVEQSAQEELHDKPVIDSGDFMEKYTGGSFDDFK